MPNTYNVNVNNNKKMKNKKEERKENSCEACANICNIFQLNFFNLCWFNY